MSFKLRTLFLALSISALAIGWYCERCRLSEFQDTWAVEKAELQAKFEAERFEMWSGVDSFTSASLAAEFLAKIDERMVFRDSPIDEAKETANEITIGQLVNLWRNKETLQHLAENGFGADLNLRDRDLMLELGADLWEYGQLTDANEFFELAKWQEFDGKNMDSEEFSSLHVFISQLVNLFEPSN